MWKTVEEFQNWWLKNGCPWRPPFDNPIFFTDNAMSLCIFREGKFQVELYLAEPNSYTPSHTHPGVESSFTYLTGNFNFDIEGMNTEDTSPYQKEGKDGNHFLLGVCSSSPDGMAHSLTVKKEGAAFLSFEYWKDKEPVSVSMNWKGEPVGEIHKEKLNGQSA